jgi:Flp pilus assembly protein TadG
MRSGKTLVLFALLLPLLLGMVGLALDSGLLLATHRQTQNAADAAATAAAMDLINGNSTTVAKATGHTYVETYNKMSGAAVTVNIPPNSGPHAGAGNTNYAEAIVTYPYSTSFVQLLGVSKSHSVTARAVAGYRLSAPVEGVMTLQQSPSGGKGLSVSGGATLTVAGPIVDNATDSEQALDVAGGSVVTATRITVSGGSDASSSTVQNYPSGSLTPSTNTGVNYADPLAYLAVPSINSGPVTNTNYGTLSGSPLTLQSTASPQDVTVNNGQTVTLQPGIYQSITVQGGGTATFASGIYVLAGGGLTISGTSTVTGSGVMFYNTANIYNVDTGVDDMYASYGAINLSGGSGFNLRGISDSSSPYYGMLVFQDRSNTQKLTVSGGSSAQTAGTWYAPTAEVDVSGGATYNSQFLVGSMIVSGGSSKVNIVPPASRGNLAYLVE